MPMFKQWVLSQEAPLLTSKGHYSLTESDFELLEDHTNDLSKGEILCRALFLSIDPITRLYLSYGISPGEPIPGRQVARVVESRNKAFPKGKVRSLSNRRNQSLVFKSSQKVALRAPYVVMCPQDIYEVKRSQRHLLAAIKNSRLVSPTVFSR